SLAKLVAAYQDHLKRPDGASLAEVCGTAQLGRFHFRRRLAIVAQSRDQLADRLALAGLRPGVSPGGARIFCGTPDEEELEPAFNELLADLKRLCGNEWIDYCRGSLWEQTLRRRLSEQGLLAPAPNGRLDRVELLSVLGRLYALGVDLDWDRLLAG